jgi:flagellar protein FlaG
MGSEAISSSILLIGAVVGAAFLVTAILPAIFSAGDTFGTVSSTAEDKIRTDFRFINTYAKDNGVDPAVDEMILWLKNVGTNRISIYDVQKADIFITYSSSVESITYDGGSGFSILPLNLGNYYWDIGETMQITIESPTYVTDGVVYTVTFALPNSIRRSTTFSTNN